MARNAEKAMTTLARWRAAQVQEAGGQRERRPYLASECNDLPQAEKWRLQIVREIAKKVAQIQNGMADELVNEAKLSNSHSPREASIRSRNDFEPITPVMPIEKVQSPKVQSPRTSTLRTSPVVTTPVSSVKGSVQLSLKSQKSIKNESLEATQVENKSLKSLSLRKDLNDNREENVIGKEDFLSSPKVWNNNNNEVKKEVEPTENTENLHNTPVYSNINKISNMSKILTDEANALRESIKSLSEGIVRTKQELKGQKDDINFPYHLFLIEIIINKINMKCECFELDYNNLVIAATFLGKPPITLYDSSYGKIDDFSDLNVGKSALFAMTYDKICSITDFVVNLSLTKQPPCSNCVSKIAETKIDYTKEFKELREELCKKWTKEQPNDNIICTTSTPLNRNMYYLSCGDNGHSDSIGIIELATRMSFLGKEITTAFCASSKPKCTSVLMKEDNGMSMYSCQNVEMDGQGKILLDENTLTRKEAPKSIHTVSARGCESPLSQFSSRQGSTKQYLNKNDYSQRYQQAGLGEFRIRDLNDEINKLMREKRHWEVQIKSLGGPDHARVGPRMLDQDGKEVPGNRGYKYFGAAKDLPGVRELFEQEPPAAPRRTRADLMRDVDADYYGYRDDDDGMLLPLEQEAEKEAIERAVDEWKRNKEENKDQQTTEEENIYPEDPDDKRIEDEEIEKPIETSHVAVPSQRDVEEALLRRKKQELLEKYGCLDVKMEES